jgi:hypothetical protein
MIIRTEHTVRELPCAVQQDPACGACGRETVDNGDGFTCVDCQLSFDTYDLSPSFLDPEAAPCGAPCDNSWHSDHRIRQGLRFDCGTCQLPAGHKSFHWTGCQRRRPQ